MKIYENAGAYRTNSGRDLAARVVPVLICSTGSNRLGVLATVLPLLMILGLCMVNFARHVQAERANGASVLMAKESITRSAERVLERVTGSTVQLQGVSQNVAYSRVRNSEFREWDTLWMTTWGQLSVRINGRNGRVYAINPMSSSPDFTGESTAKSVHAGLTLDVLPGAEKEKWTVADAKRYKTLWYNQVKDTRSVAEKAARNYLKVLGAPVHRIEEIEESSIPAEPSVSSENPEDVIWTFTYTGEVNGDSALIKVAVSASNLRLVNYWNPMEAR